MAGHDIVVVGASADGLQPLKELLRLLPRDLPSSLFIVLHTGPTGGHLLPEVLHRAGGLPVLAGRDGEKILAGRAYVPPPDHHLLVHRERMSVLRGPRENGFRPAIDPLFRSAARAYGPRVIGVVLSGMLDDGAQGLCCVVEAGGVGLVQDPFEAGFGDMPRAALRMAPGARALPLVGIAGRIAELAHGPIGNGGPPMQDRQDVVESGDALEAGVRRGRLTRLTCPECQGTLEEVDAREGNTTYRCHLGHGFTSRTLMNGQEAKLEEALWQAMRALEESAAMRARMAERAASAGQMGLSRGYQEQRDDLVARAHTIRQVLQRPAPVVDDEPQDEEDGPDA